MHRSVLCKYVAWGVERHHFCSSSPLQFSNRFETHCWALNRKCCKKCNKLEKKIFRVQSSDKGSQFEKTIIGQSLKFYIYKLDDPFYKIRIFHEHKMATFKILNCNSVSLSSTKEDLRYSKLGRLVTTRTSFITRH